MESKPPVDQFETITCSRCGGSGHHSYCQMWGTICFKCHGKGRVYTPRGAAAAAYFKQIRSKPLKDFKVGELMLFEDGVIGPDRFLRVVESKADELNTGYWTVSGADNKGFSSGYSAGPGTLAVQGFGKEEKARLFKQALEYQQTLTKKGTVRKAVR